jgi:aspartyl/asparaginyl beta-hydroxylase (cupin superfamily)
MPQKENISYSFSLTKENLPSTKETFIDPANYEWTKLIEANYELINAEVIKHFQANEKEFNPYSAGELTKGSGKWRSFGFYFWGIRASDQICSHFSETIQLLKQIPGIVSASVSVMEPGSEIKPHFGDTNAIHRCHLGLVIPGALPEVGFQAGYEKRSWEEGKLLIFNDAAYHKAWNHSTQKRVVLIFDVIRSPYLNRKLWICSRVNTILWIQHLEQRRPKFVKLLKTEFFQRTMAVFTLIKYSLFKRKSLWL